MPNGSQTRALTSVYALAVVALATVAMRFAGLLLHEPLVDAEQTLDQGIPRAGRERHPLVLDLVAGVGLDALAPEHLVGLGQVEERPRATPSRPRA